MKIYLVEPNSRYDLAALEPYGKVVYISEQINPFNVEESLKIITDGLKNFDPTEDYICMTGNLQTVAFMMMIIYNKFKTFRILMFDARTSNYRERIISRD